MTTPSPPDAPKKQPEPVKPFTIDLRCGCSGTLSIDASPKWRSELDLLVRLAEGWVSAHKPCAQNAKEKT
jgi:hypothetical protein